MQTFNALNVRIDADSCSECIGLREHSPINVETVRARVQPDGHPGEQEIEASFFNTLDYIGGPASGQSHGVRENFADILSLHRREAAR